MVYVLAVCVAVFDSFVERFYCAAFHYKCHTLTHCFMLFSDLSQSMHTQVQMHVIVCMCVGVPLSVCECLRDPTSVFIFARVCESMHLCVCVCSIRASETDRKSHQSTYVYVVACLCEHMCVCSGQLERGNVVKDFCGIFNVCY